MKVCHFCGSENEDWMKICEQCGNPILDNSTNRKQDSEDSEYIYEENEKPKTNMDLKIVIAILSLVLLCLIIYTCYIIITDKDSTTNPNLNMIEENNIVNEEETQ